MKFNLHPVSLAGSAAEELGGVSQCVSPFVQHRARGRAVVRIGACLARRCRGGEAQIPSNRCCTPPGVGLVRVRLHSFKPMPPLVGLGVAARGVQVYMVASLIFLNSTAMLSWRTWPVSEGWTRAIHGITQTVGGGGSWGGEGVGRRS
jgi:hypothetical protein